MRIAIVASEAYSHGGMSRVIESWARVLGAAGHSVHVLTSENAGAIPLPRLAGVTAETFVVDAGASRLKRFRQSAAASVGALSEIDRQERIDLILCHDLNLAVSLRRAFPATPQVVSVHSPFIDENRLNNWKYTTDPMRRLTYAATWALAWRTERLGLRAASVVHTLSDYTRSLLSERHPRLCRGVSWERIPGTFDQQRFFPGEGRRAARERLGFSPTDRILLTVRRLVPRNAVERILAAAAALRDRHDVKFLIGGVGVMLEPLRERAVAESLGRTVSFLGLIPEDVLHLHYQAADAFLLPTRDLECFGLPVIEAMASGCTPLITPVGGPAEVCRPYPQCVARANTTAAFVELVQAWAAGRIDTPSGDDLARHARREYSEEAVRPAILALVDRVRARAG